ncbi:G2/mitotic-specific cyclin s13-6-like protein [Trifolium pratense]|uniref:G2/mitotic-specific cyclin s13-6-like protein n=1 Tax=Trifolium pratense TaxID=57577 RepID=A0A2K3PPU1_TRIPR|nr:G2/mitotic-specific cyclin s13-6-like protein [Trifolium pratense]
MGKTILAKLEWTLTVPTTPFVFLASFIKVALVVSGVPSVEDALENMVHFISELGMMHYATLMYCPISMVAAAAAVFAARCTLKKSPI